MSFVRDKMFNDKAHHLFDQDQKVTKGQLIFLKLFLLMLLYCFQKSWKTQLICWEITTAAVRTNLVIKLKALPF